MGNARTIFGRGYLAYFARSNWSYKAYEEQVYLLLNPSTALSLDGERDGVRGIAGTEKQPGRINLRGLLVG